MPGPSLLNAIPAQVPGAGDCVVAPWREPSALELVIRDGAPWAVALGLALLAVALVVVATRTRAPLSAVITSAAPRVAVAVAATGATMWLGRQALIDHSAWMIAGMFALGLSLACGVLVWLERLITAAK